LLKKQIGFGCLPALEKRESEWDSRNKKAYEIESNPFGFIAARH